MLLGRTRYLGGHVNLHVSISVCSVFFMTACTVFDDSMHCVYGVIYLQLAIVNKLFWEAYDLWLSAMNYGCNVGALMG